MRRRAPIPQRRRVFLGCEGESEQSYAALLGRLVHARHVHIDSRLLRPGGGDPLALVERAIMELDQGVARRSVYVAKAVLLDADRRGQSPARDAQATTLAGQHGLSLIWQQPCHEAFLLRHLPGCDSLRPPTSDRAAQELQRRWPDYRKGLPAIGLARRIDAAGVWRAAAGETALLELLVAIRFDPG